MKSMVRGTLVVLALVGLLALGCSSAPTTPSKEQANTDGGKKPHDHSGWWCAPHGIPELECSMCQENVEKDCKAAGDWCAEHNRALSQCFYHKPERRAFYAAKYKAKYDKEPPPIPEFDDKKK